jgi:tetratricopeptide (TPR) repeat protein
VADIFVSYTSKDRDWAFWIGQELEKLEHVPRIDAWELTGGDNIIAWMLDRLQKSNHALCVISEDYFKGPFASAEFQSALWAAQRTRTNFLLPARVADCELPSLLAPLKQCDLFGVDEDEARARLIEFMKPAGKPSMSIPFPGVKKQTAELKPTEPVAFPGMRPERASTTISNVPINIPRHFLGREADLAAIDEALKSDDSRAAVTALHGLRGVGKTTLAAAYAERRKDDYRATWWIRAETDATVRADLVGLGVQLGWIKEGVPEETAVKAVLDRLAREGTDILLVYDNARNSRELAPFLPRGTGPRIIITSNAPNWRGVASSVEIDIWPQEVGADFLVVRTGRAAERDVATALSEILGGLPLAHEQAAAYCERIGVSLAEYKKRLEATPVTLLDSSSDAVGEYHGGLTVAKTFALAIEEAAKRHPAAETLICYAALLVSEPIPLYLFSEGWQTFSEPFASQIKDGGLDESVAALRAFALVDRESIPDERERSITTDCIRLHRLVRQVASIKLDVNVQRNIRRELIEAMASMFPSGLHRTPVVWPRLRRLDAIAVALLGTNDDLPEGSEIATANLLSGVAEYKDGALAAYVDAWKLAERALTIYERVLGPEHPQTAGSLNHVGYLLRAQGDFAGARRYYERALAIFEKVGGPDNPDTAWILHNLGYLLQAQSDVAGARQYFERALTINEKALGSDHPHLAASLSQLGNLSRAEGDLVGARRYLERALSAIEKESDSDSPIRATCFNEFGLLLNAEGNLSGARDHFERALRTYGKNLGAEHPFTKTAARNMAKTLKALQCQEEAKALRQEFGLTDDD